jgi:hypothetical protein
VFEWGKRKQMDKTKEKDREQQTGTMPKNPPPVVSAQEWEAAWQRLL